MRITFELKLVGVILCVFTIGCSQQNKNHQQLDSWWWMADSVPLQVIDSIEGMEKRFSKVEMPEDVRMYERLLKIRALDKACIIHTSDSAILPIVEYYSSRKKDELCLWAYYYAGRIYSDLGDSPRALEYYLKALEELPEQPDSSLLSLKGVLASQTSVLLHDQGLYDEALKYNLQSLDVALALKDTAGITTDLYGLAKHWSCVNNPDSSSYYYRKTIDMTRLSGDRNLELEATCSYASMYMKYGYGEKADSLIHTVTPYLPEYSNNSILANIVEVYEATNKTDSAKAIWTYLIEKGNLNQQIGANGWLAYHALKENDTKNAYLYTVKYNQLYDSLRKTDRMEEVARIKSLYDYSLRERDNARLEKTNHRKDVIILASGVSLLLIVALGIFFYFKERLRREKTRTLVQEIINEGLRKDAISLLSTKNGRG